MLSAIVAAVTAADQGAEPPGSVRPAGDGNGFRVEVERFADVRILRYRVPGFEQLDARTKELLYYLYEAALCGRDIIYDQKYRYNLAVRRTLELIVRHYSGDRETDAFRALALYLKRVWFANGLHHHYAHDKFEPGFSPAAFADFVRKTPAEFPVRRGQSLDDFISELTPVLFDPTVDAKLVSKSADRDVLTSSAVNFYSGLTQREVEVFYAQQAVAGDDAPVSLGLNSRLVKVDGKVVEDVQRIGGRYTQAIERMVAWLEKAAGCAENDAQRNALTKLIAFYRSGSLRDWDDYNIAWLRDTESHVDLIHGFIEVYNDPLGMRGSFESVVSFRDPEATRRIGAIASAAQWFEDHMPFLERHKKPNVTGITGKVITVVIEAGDAAPTTPIGINLPNSDWIRRAHGSKSVSLANVVAAYNAVRGGADREFSYDAAEIARNERHGELAAALHIDMHEVIGHGSGQIEPGVGPLHETLKNYGSTLEEARADLVALYYAVDPKLVELGVMPSIEVGYAAYDHFVRNALLQQLNRVAAGKDLEEDHMRNRQLIAAWAYEQGAADNVIEKRTRDGKTYFVVNDYAKLRSLFGVLLRELQRIKSTGDYAAIRALVERYGVEVDQELRAEVHARYAELDIPAYTGFLGPRLVPVREGETIVDVRIEYPDDFAAQMLEYADRYSLLPAWN
ncbi:MAG TPA: dihydrofolate reductase [Gammaproteobacteria bacterium]|nr:dihydrofolate reductase [Gammaproteobacteria bacterium]